MTNNSTLLFIIDNSNCKSEILDIEGLFDMEDETLSELDTLLKDADYSPSDEVIERILARI